MTPEILDNLPYIAGGLFLVGLLLAVPLFRRGGGGGKTPGQSGKAAGPKEPQAGKKAGAKGDGKAGAEDGRGPGGLAILGVVPAVDEGHSLLIHSLPATAPLSEAYRQVWAQLDLKQKMVGDAEEPRGRVFAVAGLDGHSGASTTTANLATAAAHLGYSVLVVDADLARPNQHDLLCPYTGRVAPGLADLLAGDDLGDAADVAQKTVVDGVRLIAAGDTDKVADLFALMPSQTAVRFVRSVAPALAEVILFDCPPVLSGEPGMEAIWEVEEGLLLVVGADGFDKGRLAQTVKALADAGGEMRGAILVPPVPDEEEDESEPVPVATRSSNQIIAETIAAAEVEDEEAEQEEAAEAAEAEAEAVPATEATGETDAVEDSGEDESEEELGGADQMTSEQQGGGRDVDADGGGEPDEEDEGVGEDEDAAAGQPAAVEEEEEQEVAAAEETAPARPLFLAEPPAGSAADGGGRRRGTSPFAAPSLASVPPAAPASPEPAAAAAPPWDMPAAATAGDEEEEAAAPAPVFAATGGLAVATSEDIAFAEAFAEAFSSAPIPASLTAKAEEEVPAPVTLPVDPTPTTAPLVPSAAPAPVAVPAVSRKTEMMLEMLTGADDATTLRATTAGPVSAQSPRVLLEITTRRGEGTGMRAGTPTETADGSPPPDVVLETTTREETPDATTMRLVVSDAAPGGGGADGAAESGNILEASLQKPEAMMIRSGAGQSGDVGVRFEVNSDQSGGTRFRATVARGDDGSALLVEMERTLVEDPLPHGTADVPKKQWRNRVSLRTVQKDTPP